MTDPREALFLRLASRPIPRIARMMAVVTELGYVPRFGGASRDASLPRQDTWEGIEIERIGRSFPLVNGRRPLTYLSGVLSFWWAAVRLIRMRRPALVHASDVEAVVPSIVACRLLGIPLVYNIHDNLAVRYVLPGLVGWVLNQVEGLCVRLSDVTLVPEPFRRDLLPSWARSRVRVVRNAPEDPGFHPREAPREVPQVLFAGWLDRGRGLRDVLALACRGEIELLVAGEGDDELQQEMRTTPNVTYVGFCNHREVIALTVACDYVAAFYDPARTINRFAASNKIAEALAVGRPVLINVELEVAAGLRAAGAVIAVPYSGIASIGAELAAYRATPARYREAARAARRHYETHYHSTTVRAASLEALREAGVR